jgi:hypothetical protein
MLACFSISMFEFSSLIVVLFLGISDCLQHSAATMNSPRRGSESNILNSVLQDIIISTGSPVAQPPAVEEGWDEYTRTVSASHDNHRTSALSGASGKANSALSDWERYYGEASLEASSQNSNTRVLSPPPRADPSRQSKREGAENESSEEYPKGLQLALIILGVCLSVYIIALNRQIVSTV